MPADGWLVRSVPWSYLPPPPPPPPPPATATTAPPPPDATTGACALPRRRRYRLPLPLTCPDRLATASATAIESWSVRASAALSAAEAAPWSAALSAAAPWSAAREHASAVVSARASAAESAAAFGPWSAAGPEYLSAVVSAPCASADAFAAAVAPWSAAGPEYGLLLRLLARLLLSLFAGLLLCRRARLSTGDRRRHGDGSADHRHQAFYCHVASFRSNFTCVHLRRAVCRHRMGRSAAGSRCSLRCRPNRSESCDQQQHRVERGSGACHGASASAVGGCRRDRRRSGRRRRWRCRGRLRRWQLRWWRLDRHGRVRGQLGRDAGRQRPCVVRHIRVRLLAGRADADQMLRPRLRRSPSGPPAPRWLGAIFGTVQVKSSPLTVQALAAVALTGTSPLGTDPLNTTLLALPAPRLKTFSASVRVVFLDNEALPSCSARSGCRAAAPSRTSRPSWPDRRPSARPSRAPSSTSHGTGPQLRFRLPARR